MIKERISISLLGKTYQLYDKQITEIQTTYFPYMRYKENVREIIKFRIYKETIDNARIYYIFDRENDRIVIVRDDQQQVESIIKRVKGLIITELINRFGFKKFGVKEFDEEIRIIEGDMVMFTKQRSYTIKPASLPPLIVYYGTDKDEDGKICKEARIPLKMFINAVIFAVKFSFATNEEKAKMLYENGKSIREIAKDLGLSYTQARYLLIKAGTKLRKREIPKSVKEKIEELAKQGKSAHQIAKELALNEVTVLNYLRKLNLIKRKKKLTPDEINAIAQMYKEGKSIYEIAKKLGRSTNLIVYYLKKLGLKNVSGS